MTFEIERADTFLREFKKHKKDGEFLNALDKKIKRLIEDPEKVGGFLSGKLHGYKSTRIIRKFRLIFKIDYDKKIVYLSAIDHRKSSYKDFYG